MILDSGPRLGNHCRFLPGNDTSAAVILDFRPRLGNHCRKAAAVATTSSASDSNLRRRKKKWVRLQRPWRLRGPRPILIFVVAKKNGFACYGRSSNEVPRPILIFVAAKKNWFAYYGRRGNEVRVRF